MSQIHPKTVFLWPRVFHRNRCFFPRRKAEDSSVPQRGFRSDRRPKIGKFGAGTPQWFTGNPRTKWPEVYSWEHHINIYTIYYLYIYNIWIILYICIILYIYYIILYIMSIIYNIYIYIYIVDIIFSHCHVGLPETESHTQKVFSKWIFTIWMGIYLSVCLGLTMYVGQSGTKNHIKSLVWFNLYAMLRWHGSISILEDRYQSMELYIFTYPLGIEHDYRKLPLMISKSPH